MNNISIFKEFWLSYTEVLGKIYNRNSENLQLEKLEDLIYETKDVFIKNTQQKTGVVFSTIELAEVNVIVDSFIKS
jgi:hypothetical protein